MVHKRGGKVTSLVQYQEEQQKSLGDLLRKVDEINNNQSWQL